MQIKLPIYFNTDESTQFRDLGMEDSISLEQAEVKDIIFYNINAIDRYEEDGKFYTRIYANGEQFICPLQIDEVEQKIDCVLNPETYA